MKYTLGWMQVGLLTVGLLAGCANGGSGESSEKEATSGTIALPLVTHGASGTSFRLRNATFEIVPYQYYSSGYASTGGAAARSTGTYRTTPTTGTRVTQTIILDSETDPTAESIQVQLEEGNYYIRLMPGWSMETTSDGQFVAVDAQLLSGENQWIWISPHSTSWVSYQFGIGDRATWFNGSLNVEMTVYENPDQYYGSGGWGGATWRSGTYTTASGGTDIYPSSGGGASSRGTY